MQEYQESSELTGNSKFITTRIKLGLKIVWRDTGARYSFLSVFLLVGLWFVNELYMQSTDPSYSFHSNPNNGLLIGVYVGSLLTCAVRVALMEYLVEKRKKMFSFLSCIGLSKFSYYLFHLGWNCVMSLLLLLPFVTSLAYLVGASANQLFMLLLTTAVGSLANALYVMSIALFFTSEVSGLNVIGTLNFVISTATLLIPESSPFHFLVYSNPQSQLVKMIESFAIKTDSHEPFTFNFHLYIMMISIVIFTGLFCLFERLSKNEYGFYNKNSLCRKKKVHPAMGDGDERAEYSETELTEVGFGFGEEETKTVLENSQIHREDVVLNVERVKKSFGSNSVLEGVSFKLNKGEILCLLGANGAGKSTLFNIILGMIEQDSGSIFTSNSKKNVSFCPQHDLGWDYLTVGDHFELVRSIIASDINDAHHEAKVRDITLLGSHWNTFSKNLSGGYKRRLTLALSLLNNSPLVLMDEPTTALDMEVRHHVMGGIAKAREELGTTILFTTHHLEDAEIFADTVLILSKGRVLLQGSIEELRQQFNLATIKLSKVDAANLVKVKQYVTSNMSKESDVKEEGTNCFSIRVSYEPELIVKHLNYFEGELKLLVNIRQTSLEEVYLMDGEFDNYGSTDNVGKLDMELAWQTLSAPRKLPGFLRSFLLMLSKNFKIAIRDSSLATKSLLSLLLPLVVSVIFTRAMADAQKKPKKRDPLNLAITFLIYTASIELSLLAHTPSGIIIRSAEYENKSLYFLKGAGGSPMAYRLSLLTLDSIELLLICFSSFFATQMMWEGVVHTNSAVYKLILLVLIHQLAKMIIIAYPVSLLFETKKSLLSYFSLLQFGLTIVFLAPCFTILQAAPQSPLLKGLYYLSPTRVIAQAGISLIPDSAVSVVPYRDSIAEQWGGYSFNLLIVFIHLLAGFAINLYLEDKKYTIRIENIKKTQGEGLVQNIQEVEEIREERDWADSTRPPVSILNVEKTYSNGVTAVRDISFGVESGQTFTLLGPNGAGKSSLLDIVCATSNRTGGEIYFEGKCVEKYKSKRLSFCLQKNFLWEQLTFREHLQLIAEWRGLPQESIQNLISEISQGLDVGKHLNIQATHLSGGNQRKLNTLLALLAAPKIFVLDEPTAGVDPKARRYFWNVLQGWTRKSSCAMLLTTHTAAEAEELSDKIGIIINGELVRVNTLTALTSQAYVLKISSRDKLPSHWSHILECLESELNEIAGQSATEVKILQNNKTNKAILQVPVSESLPHLGSALEYLKDFCAKNAPSKGPPLIYYAGRLTLEQAFLAYAAHQVQRDPTGAQ